MRRFPVLLLVIALIPTELLARSITIRTEPANARIYQLGPAGDKKLLGTGMVKFDLRREQLAQIRIEADGFVAITKDLDGGARHPKEILVPLIDRLVRISVSPYDATIYKDGAAIGTQEADVTVPQGKSVTVEVKKIGYRGETRAYFNDKGKDIPPLTDRIELADRVVLLTANPVGTGIFANENFVGETTAEIVVPKDQCMTVRFAKRGHAALERVYCNKPQAPEMPLTDSVTLKDRVVAVRVTPSTADIIVNGRKVAQGEFDVRVMAGECVEVAAAQEGHVGREALYCNQSNMQAPPPEEHFLLPQDEAFLTSVRSDVANVNVTIEVNPNLAPDQAWKLMSSIVMNYFDVLEMSDKETGYLRTAWQVTHFPHNTIRTRVIVRLGDTSPLKYVVKIASEYSGQTNTSVKEDDKFREWDRILNGYKGIIAELQARLK